MLTPTEELVTCISDTEMCCPLTFNIWIGTYCVFDFKVPISMDAGHSEDSNCQ